MNTIEALGFTKGELEEKIIQRIADQMLNREVMDEEGDKSFDAWMVNTHLQFEIQRAIEKTLADANGKLAEEITVVVKDALGEWMKKMRVTSGKP